MFGTRLKELREEMKLTQENLAKILNVARATVGRYENDDRFPDKEIFEKIADFFEVSTDYLLGRVDSRGNVYSANEDLYDISIEYINIAKRIADAGISPTEIEIMLLAVKKIKEEHEKNSL